MIQQLRARAALSEDQSTHVPSTLFGLLTTAINSIFRISDTLFCSAGTCIDLCTHININKSF